MKCAYNAAILDRFLDDHVTFDYVIGVSAGAGNTASYLAGQRGRNLPFYTDLCHDPEYFGWKSLLKTGALFNMDYIYGTLSNEDGRYPLDWEALQANPAAYEVVATDAITGRPRYFDKSEIQRNHYVQFMAGSSLPAVCKPRVIDGIPYYDGGISDPIPVDRALSKGCDRLVVITSKPRDYVRQPQGMRWFYRYACRKYPIIVDMIDHRHITYMERFRHVFDLERAGTAFVMAPSKALPMSTYDMNEAQNQALYDLGLDDYAQMREALATFCRQ